MKLCEQHHNRKVYRLRPPESIRVQCNRVECIGIGGKKCECWMSFPNEIDQPNHDKTIDIVVDEERDQGISANYYGLSAMIMGVAGIVLFLILWAKEGNLF